MHASLFRNCFVPTVGGVVQTLPTVTFLLLCVVDFFRQMRRSNFLLCLLCHLFALLFKNSLFRATTNPTTRGVFCLGHATEALGVSCLGHASEVSCLVHATEALGVFCLGHATEALGVSCLGHATEALAFSGKSADHSPFIFAIKAPNTSGPCDRSRKRHKYRAKLPARTPVDAMAGAKNRTWGSNLTHRNQSAKTPMLCLGGLPQTKTAHEKIFAAGH